MLDHDSANAEVDDGDEEERGVADVVGQRVHQLQQYAADGDADHLRQNAHRRPDAEKLARFIRRRQHIRRQRPVHTGIGSIADAEERAGNQRAILALIDDEEQANDGHHRA